MRQLLSALAALLLVTAAAAAPLPAEPPPLTVALDFRTVRVNGDNLEVDRVVTVFELIPKTEVREIDGRKVPVTVQVPVPVTRIVREARPLKGVTAVTAQTRINRTSSPLLIWYASRPSCARIATSSAVRLR